ncbi:putative phage repressor (plasmid) [Leptospira interrogans serovar Linhai str. 56609]|uniref:DNA-binding protein n=1 Tax=Leptospira interrogans TaxID=173 RepID=UPI0005DA2133|nr:DNA-binding protein [Leptospira interrogans]AJR16739.1 putative phage repressor [Leptospira interrogans serovar Linhai str. 56609]
MRHKDKGQGKRLGVILEETNLLSKELAAACDAFPEVISLYLSNKRDIPFDLAYKIMLAYGYSPFWLIFGDGEKFVSKDLLESLTQNQIETIYEIDRNRVFNRRLDESGFRPMVERLLELDDDRERKIFLSIFDRFFPKGSE